MSNKSDNTNSDTDQTGLIRDEKGRIIGGKPPAGFDKHPENRSDGGWKKEDSIGYQYRMLQRLTLAKLEKWIEEHPKNVRTVAQDLAYKALIKAQRELPYLKEVTDRTEGKPQQQIDVTSDGEGLFHSSKLKIEVVDHIEKPKIEENIPPTE